MMQTNNKSNTVLLVSCMVVLAAIYSGLLTGCQAQKTAYSGFLGDYSKLRPSPEVEDALYYQTPGKSLKDYDKFMIDPVLVHFAPNAKGTALDPAKLKKVTDYVYDEAAKALAERYTVVTAPGRGVLRLRAALTDIKKTTPAMNIHPATKLSGLGLGGASMEAEALDSQTGERVFAVVDTRQGDRLAIAAGLDPLGHAKQVIKHWIERFVKRVDKAHGYGGT
ncbi:MAG: DUF3313 domain-containing protein [Phycisphaerales bacterium]|nr:MAG: DUF3313 domain-containing protein [Phycisphaerales bacterium]